MNKKSTVEIKTQQHFKHAVAGLIFGVFAVIGLVAVTAFTEPTSGPTGFDEPENTRDKGDWVGFGRGWVPNSSGAGSTALTKAECDSSANWYWFEDGNGDGDAIDEEDGVCVKTVAAASSSSWNGAEQITPNNLGSAVAPESAASGSGDSITKTSAGWTVDAYKNHIVKIQGGTAANCWGRVKSNTADTITVYGSWLTSAYASDCGTPDATSTFFVSDDWGQYDNSFIGDYSCAGNFDDVSNGTVSLGSYPSSGTIALAVADCYDGKRDLLPSEEDDRWVVSGTATAADATSVTDSSLNLDTNVWIGQKVLITSGTGDGSYGFIESNDGTKINVTDWLGGVDPVISSGFKIIYIVPHASYNPNADIDGDDNDPRANNGPLMAEHLKSWKGTRLPTSNDFIGFCGATDGDSYNTKGDSAYHSSGASDDKSIGNFGGNIGMGTASEYMDLSNSESWEWLSELYAYRARVGGSYACSYFGYYTVGNGHRFRAVFRPQVISFLPSEARH